MRRRSEAKLHHASGDTGNGSDVQQGYKRTEAGVISADWDEHHLRTDVSLLSGHHVMARDCNVHGVGLPYLTGPADFPDGHIRQTKFTTKPTQICRPGDILVTVKGSGAGTLVEADAEYCISRQLMAIRTTTWNSTFLRYSLLQNASRFKAASTGLIPGLSRSDILDQPIPIPSSLAEQRAIAAVLSDVDELIGSLEALVAKKRAIKQAAMQKLLTGGTRLPGFGGGKWETKRLEELAVVTMGQSPPSASYNVVGDGLPLIQGNADIVRRTTIDRIWTTLPSKRCGSGDIVLTVRAPVGSVARASKRACLGRGVCGLKPLGHGPFLYYALILRESHWEDVEQGSTFSAANSAQVAGFPIAVPMDKLEQRAHRHPSSPTWTPKSPPWSNASTRPVRSSRV